MVPSTSCSNNGAVVGGAVGGVVGLVLILATILSFFVVRRRKAQAAFRARQIDEHTKEVRALSQYKAETLSGLVNRVFLGGHVEDT